MFEILEAIADWLVYKWTWRKRRAYVAMVFKRLGVE